MNQEGLFRKAALDKMASPEQLDLLMHVTSPKGWLALWTTGVLLLGIIIWSVFGTIPTRVDGEGILIRGGNLSEIESIGNGVLTQFTVNINDAISKGQVIGIIDQPDLDERIRTVQLSYEKQARDFEVTSSEDRATIAANRADVNRTNLELEKVNEELEIKRASLSKGLITRSAVLTVERDKVNLEAQITNKDAAIRQLEQRIRQRRIGVEAALRELEELQTKGSQVSQVRSTVSGRIVEIKKFTGDQVQVGEAIAVLEPLIGAMEPVLYVLSTNGKQIQPGMEAQVSPSTVKKEEFGYIKGEIKAVGEYPVTPNAAMAVVANQQLVNELLGKETKIEIRADLLNADTVSGFSWSSSSGPPFKIAGGTRITVSVIVDRRSPITYVLPIIKSTLGVS